MKFKTGMRPFVHNAKSIHRLGVIRGFFDALGKPPADSMPYGEMYEKAVGDTKWGGMLGNGPDPDNPPAESEGVGDCVICDDLRCISLWSALGTGPLYTPTTPDAYELYSAITRFDPSDPDTDQGTDPNANASYMQATGYKGYKLDGWTPIDPANEDHIKWAIQIYGAVKYCLKLPDFADTQFEEQGYWDYTGQKYSIVGGHDVMGMQYRADGSMDVATWSKRIYMTPAFAREFLTMVIAPYSKAFIMSTGTTPAGLNVEQMDRDLNLVSN